VTTALAFDDDDDEQVKAGVAARVVDLRGDGALCAGCRAVTAFISSASTA
jgi:hypothetical protein